MTVGKLAPCPACHSYAISHDGAVAFCGDCGEVQLEPSPRRFDVLGGPGGYLSARHVGAMRPGEYVDGWDRLVRVNVPRRIRRPISPRTVYLDVLRHYRALGCAV